MTARRSWPQRLAPCLCLLLAAVLALAAEDPAAAQVAAGSGPTVPSGGAVVAAAAGTQAQPTQVAPRSFCNPASANFTTQPVPCTDDQEQGALEDLLQETLSPGLPGVLPGASPDLMPPEGLLDTSQCNATDAEGFTLPVDLMDPDLMQVVWAVADAYIADAGNTSFWQQSCEGDITHDPFNACQQPQMVDLEGGEAGTHYRVQMKLACSLGTSDTIALEADAYLLRDLDSSSNVTVSAIEWFSIPLPAPSTGQ